MPWLQLSLVPVSLLVIQMAHSAGTLCNSPLFYKCYIKEHLLIMELWFSNARFALETEHFSLPHTHMNISVE